MNFKDAIEQAKLGKKIKRPEWGVDIHLTIINDQVKAFRREAVAYSYEIDTLLKYKWVIYDEFTPSEMNFFEALAVLKQGKKIRMVGGMDDDSYIAMDNDGKTLYGSVVSSFNFSPTFQCFTSDDWIAFD